MRPLETAGDLQSGQAVLEYILVLVVVVAMVMGVVFQFNEAFKNYLSSYFGDYISCLLETGELPGLGGTGTTAGICDSEFQPFALASGRPRVQVSKGGAPNDSTGRTGGAGFKGGNLRPRSFVRRGGAFNGENRSLGRSGRPGSQKVSTGGKSANSGAASSGEGGDTNILVRRGRRRSRRRGKGSFISSSLLSEKDKRKAGEKAVTVVEKSKEERERENLRNIALSFDPEKLKKTQTEADVSMSVSFGAILKFLLIGGLLVLILIFFGGQAMQIKKGWTKN